MVKIQSRDYLTILLLVMILLQVFVFVKYPNQKDVFLIKESLGSIVKLRWWIPLTPKNNIDHGIKTMARKLDDDLPHNSKILFIKDTNDGTDLSRYFKINYLLNTPKISVYNFEKMPTIERIATIMKESNSDYLVTYATILPTYRLLSDDSISARGKIFVRKGDKIKLLKEYADKW